MDSNGFERINLCYITPSSGYKQMLNKISLTDRRKHSCSFTWIDIILVATQRTGLPTSEISDLECYW